MRGLGKVSEFVFDQDIDLDKYIFEKTKEVIKNVTKKL